MVRLSYIYGNNDLPHIATVYLIWETTYGKNAIYGLGRLFMAGTMHLGHNKPILYRSTAMGTVYYVL